MTWLERILAAEERKKSGETPFTDDDRLRAASWLACAVGEQRERGVPFVVSWTAGCLGNPYQVAGRVPFPEDGDLFWAGLRFVDAVVEQNPARAEAVLAEIEGRALQLKRAAYADE